MQDWLSERARATPTAFALFFQEQRLTYAQLHHKTETFREQLSALGIQPGDHIGLLMPNCIEYVCLIHALARIGCVLVPFNTRLTAPELEKQRAHVNVKTIICNSETKAAAAQLRAFSLTLDQLASLPPNTPIAPAQFSLDNLQAIVFTSGTTGDPKGVMLTFANHFYSATASAFRLGHHPTDRWLSVIPLYHVGGLAVIFRACLYGIAIDLHPRFDLAAVNASLDSNAITLISVVPTMLVRLLDTRTKWPSSLRLILLGGAAATPDLLAKCCERNLPISPTYGLTETSSQVATITPADSVRKPGSVGKPLLFSSVRILLRDENERIIGDAPPNVHGEIAVRGPTVMRGYYHNEVATQRALTLSDPADFGKNESAEDAQNQWPELLTGDIGYLDDDGDLFVLQRRSDLIISGGENIYPAEVENALRSHPNVTDACIVGVPDAEWGQRVVAMVITDADPLSARDLLDHVRPQLARYKLPREIKFVDALPRTASGKVQRHAVVEAFLQGRID